MQLVTKIVAGATGGLVLTGVIIGISVPLVKQHKNYVSGDCSTVICDEHMECIKEENKPPTCNCISGFVSEEKEADGGSKKFCHKACGTTSDCETGEVCKDLAPGIVCLASINLNTCDAIQCDDTQECHLVDDTHPQCKCPSNELLIETDGTSERRCRKSCTDTDKCKPGTLCFRESTSTPLYCEDKDRIADCTGELVKCSEDTECRTKKGNTDCRCLNGASTLIKPTDTGSERICGRKACHSVDNCRTMVCFTDPYSIDRQCVEPSDVHSCDFVHCTNNLSCNEDDNFSCGCLEGETELETFCFKVCDTEKVCKTENLGKCIRGHCESGVPRDTAATSFT